MPISGPGLGGQDQSKTKDAQSPPEEVCETSENSNREGDCTYLACTVGNERLTASPSSACFSPFHTSFSFINSVHPSKGSSPGCVPALLSLGLAWKLVPKMSHTNYRQDGLTIGIFSRCRKFSLWYYSPVYIDNQPTYSSRARMVSFFIH